MKKRIRFNSTILILVTITIAFVSVNAQSTSSADKPNVVIMLADNVGYGDIGAYGAGEVRGMPTPRIDEIASQGLRLTQFLVEPGCTPSRAALMTGGYPQRAGLSTIIVAGTPNTLQAGEVTPGELFKTQGYATAYADKWHLGASEQSWPTHQGFDEYHVGVIETTDGTLYRDAMQRTGLTEAVIGAAEPYIWESEANGTLKKVRPYNLEYRRQVEGILQRHLWNSSIVKLKLSRPLPMIFEKKIFKYWEPGVGAGFRVLLQKKSRTVICIDYAMDKHESSGLFFGLNEVF